MDLAQRKREVREMTIRDLANFISIDYMENYSLNLEKLVKNESILLHYDHYKDSFDGLLIYEDKDFYIHLNIDSGNFRDSRRSRFSIAHELGHYSIPEHHEAIVNGTFPCHPSKFRPKQRNEIEVEADIFASCLLMPSSLFKKACYNRNFSFALIDELANKFNVSRTSALLRFADFDAGTYPLMITFYRNGLLTGYKQSNDFPFKDVPFRSKIGNPPPPTSVIGEYYLKNESKFKDVQEVYVEDWFWRDSLKKLNEQCFYSNYDYDISVVTCPEIGLQ